MPEKLLLVDDEANVLSVLYRLFMDEAYEILTTQNPREALELLKKEDIGVMISDHRMPEMTGTELLEKAREIKPETVRMMLTGYTDLDATLDAINRGNVHRFFQKPWDDLELKTAVKNAFERYTLSSENKRLNTLTRQQNEELRCLNQHLELRVEERTREVNALLKSLEKSFRESIRIFTGLLELFSPDLLGHSRRVSALSREIAQLYGLEKDACETIEMAGLLHDIGLIGVPETLLSRAPETLKRHETALIQQHPALGHATLSQLDGMKEIAEMVYAHHENLDGTGYPLKIKKEKIPLGARMIHIANDLDHLIHHRKLSRKNALQELFPASGKKVDPDIVMVLTDMTPGYPPVEKGQKTVRLNDLTPGMILAAPIRTVMGRLLLPSDTELKDYAIERLKKFNEVDPIIDRILVYF